MISPLKIKSHISDRKILPIIHVGVPGPYFEKSNKISSDVAIIVGVILYFSIDVHWMVVEHVLVSHHYVWRVLHCSNFMCTLKFLDT